MVQQYCYPIDRKTLGDYYEMAWRCAKCAFCRNVFPSDTEHERFGRQCPSGDRFKYESYFASGRNELARRTIEKQQEFTERFRHILYTCTTCGACEEWCQATQGLFPLKITMAMRRHFFQNGGILLPEHTKIIENIKGSHNRLDRNNRDRKSWLGDRTDTSDTADIVYFVGCRSSFRRKEIARSTYDLVVEKLGIKVKLLEDERCCGRPLIDIGEEETALELMKHNVEQIQSSGAQKVLFSCAECFHTFREIEKYGIDIDFEPLHLSQFLIPFLKEGLLPLRKLESKMAYHDPCYLGRHQGIYDEPRDILSSIPGAELVEMPRNRKNSWCCGSGGGVNEAFQQFSHWSACERFEEVAEVNAELLVTSCPGCKNNFWGLASSRGVKILDLAEIVLKNYGG